MTLESKLTSLAGRTNLLKVFLVPKLTRLCFLLSQSYAPLAVLLAYVKQDTAHWHCISKGHSVAFGGDTVARSDTEGIPRFAAVH